MAKTTKPCPICGGAMTYESITNSWTCPDCGHVEDGLTVTVNSIIIVN
jgi:rubredoxin